MSLGKQRHTPVPGGGLSNGERNSHDGVDRHGWKLLEMCYRDVLTHFQTTAQ
jgi:hypothetical protein